MTDLKEQWAESLTLFFLVVGFMFAVLMKNAAFSYITILLCGGLAGRTYYTKRETQPIFPFVLIILGFLLGYLIGGVWVSRIWVFIFFALGFGVSYYLHLKKILVIFKSENYIK
jgi:RsiW-degrading membrane proteinase PrsW (M82 family)